MKKIIIMAVAGLLFTTAITAQIRVDTTKTITATDTLRLLNVPDKIVSVTATYVESSGTSAGKFYIEGSGDGRGWVHIDSSKSLADVTTAQSVTVALTATTYASYRVRCSNTSSATGTLYFTALRRPDDRVPEPAPIPVAKSKYIPGYEVNAWRNYSYYILATKP